MHINYLEDIGKHYRWAIKGLFCRLRKRTDCPEKLNLRELYELETILLAGWVQIRDIALPLLEPLLWRFDVNSFVQLMEERLYTAILMYHGVFKNDSLRYPFHEGMAHLATHAPVTARKNYKFAMPDMLSQLLHLHDSNHPAKEIGKSAEKKKSIPHDCIQFCHKKSSCLLMKLNKKSKHTSEISFSTSCSLYLPHGRASP